MGSALYAAAQRVASKLPTEQPAVNGEAVVHG